MEFKGLAWVGNVYQKFEAMCLEVEELIVQDTAKYVESQVQNVGNSMKKFCADLLPDDSVASEKPLPVSMLHEYAPLCSFKKKKESFSTKTRDVKQEQEVTEGKKNGCEMKLSGLDGEDHNTCTPPGEVARLNSKDECQKDDKTENEHGVTMVNSARTQDAETRTESEHCLEVASSVRSQDSVTQPSVAISLRAGCDDCRKETDEDSLQTSSSSVSEQKFEILQQLSGRSVEESCIIVDRDELHCVFPDRKESDKHKPYKKIREAISSRMKQNREKEYKLLARQWFAEDVVNGIECGDNPKQIEEKQSSEESEWELL